jgi:hypothetical protein
MSCPIHSALSYPVVTVRVHDHVVGHQPANCFWVVLGCEKRSELFFGSRERLRRVRIGVGHSGIMRDSPQLLQKSLYHSLRNSGVNEVDNACSREAIALLKSLDYVSTERLSGLCIGLKERGRATCPPEERTHVLRHRTESHSTLKKA